MSYLFTLLISSCIEIRNDVDSFEEKGDNSNLNFTIMIIVFLPEYFYGYKSSSSINKRNSYYFI